jgi:hypothetical protein
MKKWYKNVLECRIVTESEANQTKYLGLELNGL